MFIGDLDEVENYMLDQITKNMVVVIIITTIIIIVIAEDHAQGLMHALPLRYIPSPRYFFTHNKVNYEGREL
jgi:hypothetical protein